MKIVLEQYLHIVKFWCILNIVYILIYLRNELNFRISIFCIVHWNLRCFIVQLLSCVVSLDATLHVSCVSGKDGRSVLFLPIPIPQKIPIFNDTNTDTVFFTPTGTDTPKNTDPPSLVSGPCIFTYKEHILQWGSCLIFPEITMKTFFACVLDHRTKNAQ